MKKSGKILPNLYLIGMALVVIGFILPMFKCSSISKNGFDFINFKNFSSATIGAILIFLGGVAGVVFCFLKNTSSTKKLIALLVSIAGFIILLICFNDNPIAKVIGKGIIKHAYIGFYCVIMGLILALTGWKKA
ncbi:MAG: hypothetical protein UHY90_08240 [Treponema sp.]|nr:hypothetical protein [Spirochaetia bacterium]MDD7459426.1 hypothetical protein [Spirochaetales bacterium]MDY5810535.1 hypothetical protein [Treponema sp.]MEE1182228.1 hypothetical protein [Treponema sp.]